MHPIERHKSTMLEPQSVACGNIQLADEDRFPPVINGDGKNWSFLKLISSDFLVSEINSNY